MWWKDVAIRFIGLAALLPATLARCPNACSGHGLCSVNNVCECFEGWDGGAADCSWRECPEGIAWADKAYANDRAHQMALCSNAGTCDTRTGTCRCYEGFTGTACQRSKCPNDCSGHGVCASLRDVSVYQGPDYDTSVSTAGDGLGTEYNNWDKNSIQLCECDRGYFGPDCSQKMCAKGDDPLTMNQNYRKIHLHIIHPQPSNEAEAGTEIGLSFNGQTLYFDVRQTDLCAKYFAFKGPFGHLACDEVINDNINWYDREYDMTFYSWPTFPKDNNLFSNDGNPSILDFSCDTSGASGADKRGLTSCTFTDLVSENIREYAYCANRGNCDFTTGVCDCQIGFGGPACANTTAQMHSRNNSEPGLQVNAEGYSFTSTVLRLDAERSKSEDFYFIEAIADDERVFYVQGDGGVGMTKLLDLDNGETITDGGLYVQGGGITVADQGLSVASYQRTTTPLFNAESRYSGVLDPQFSVMEVSSNSPSDTHYLFKAKNQGSTRFSIRADGLTELHQGGMHVSNGVSILSNGLTITGGMTVFAGDVYANDGAYIDGGLQVNNNGLKVLIGGMQVAAGGLSVYSGGFRMTGGGTILSGGMRITGGTTVMSGGLMVTGGMTLNSVGLVISDGGLTIEDGGMVVTQGGLTIEQGGLILTGGLTTHSGGIDVTGGLTINSGGAQVTGGLTVYNSGVRVLAGGLEIDNGGLRITGGATVHDIGVAVTGGLSVNAGGLTVTGGMSITDGLAITSGGMTVFSGGMNVAGTTTIFGDVHITGTTFLEGTLTTAESPVIMNGGLTVFGDVYLETLQLSDRRLKTNLAPIGEALEKVSRLQGVYYDWIQNEPGGMTFDTDRHVGVIAQEVQSVLPEVVNDKKFGEYLSVDYGSMIPLLIEAIHDLEAMLSPDSENEDEPRLAAQTSNAQVVQEVSSEDEEGYRQQLSAALERMDAVVSQRTALSQEVEELKTTVKKILSSK